MKLEKNINRVELQGVVGAVIISGAGDARVIRFSLATTLVYRNQAGDAVVETTWHGCVAREGRGIAALETIVNGAAVHLCGRIRRVMYTSADGTERAEYEIVAVSLEVLS